MSKGTNNLAGRLKKLEQALQPPPPDEEPETVIYIPDNGRGPVGQSFDSGKGMVRIYDPAHPPWEEEW